MVFMSRSMSMSWIYSGLRSESILSARPSRLNDILIVTLLNK